MAESAVVLTRVSREIRDAFRTYCQRRASTTAAQLRRLIDEALENDRARGDVESTLRQVGRGARRIELRLRPAEGRLAQHLADQDGVSVQHWFIARLLDAGLQRDGRFLNTQESRRLAEEIERIMRSLLGMANNLNQVARALNSTRVSGQKIAPERLMVLSVIEKDLMAYVHRAHAVLERLDDPREATCQPRTNEAPITRELCEQLREKLDSMASS